MIILLDELHLTGWYPAKIRPSRVGPYQCLYRNGDGKWQEVYSTWTGANWTPVSQTLDDLKPVRKRAKHQKIRWRGLTALGFELMSGELEQNRLAIVGQDNQLLLEKIRAKEVQIAAAKSDAEGFYLKLMADCLRSPQLAAVVRKQSKTPDLADLRPSLSADDYVTYAQTHEAIADESNTALHFALLEAKLSATYWKTYWHGAGAQLEKALGKKNKNLEIGSKGQVLHLPDFKPLFNKNGGPKSAPGNPGSKR